MKITPDSAGRDDGYDDSTVRYYEELTEDGYFYELYVLIDGWKAKVIVTDNGVSVDFWEGRTVFTNLKPQRMFQGRDSLKWPQLRKILRVLETTEVEGKSLSFEEMEALYQRWLEETGE